MKASDLIRDIAAMDAVKTVVIRESKGQDKNVLDLLALDSIQSVHTYIVQDPVFDKIDNTVNGQGVVAIVSKPKHNIESISIEGWTIYYLRWCSRSW